MLLVPVVFDFAVDPTQISMPRDAKFNNCHSYKHVIFDNNLFDLLDCIVLCVCSFLCIGKVCMIHTSRNAL